MWWLGECEHEWEAVVAARVKGTGCPYCGSKKLLTGFNDLETLNPELANQWHPSLNGNLKPNQIMSNHNGSVWWLGECGHEWEARVSNRNKLKRGCPYCSGQKTLPGFNDFASMHPEVAAQWHPTLNINLNSTQLSFRSARKVWWQCEKGHEWETTVYNRVRKNYGCPICSNRQVLAGFNDLATLYPKLASEWHPTLNGDLLPEQVTAGFERKRISET